jgi:hypothetical protein
MPQTSGTCCLQMAAEFRATARLPLRASKPSPGGEEYVFGRAHWLRARHATVARPARRNSDREQVAAAGDRGVE